MEIIQINSKPRYIMIEEDYIKELKEIIENYKEIERNYKMMSDNLWTICDKLIITAMQGNYEKDNEKIMLELKELNKILTKLKK